MMTQIENTNKPNYMFWFTDRPQTTAVDSRLSTAHRLKCYRANPKVYTVIKTGLHSFRIECHRSGYRVAIEQT